MIGMSDNVLRTYGCSFTWGLIRQPEEYVGITDERNRCKPWGDFIAEALEIEHHNHASSGSGSKQIAWNVINSGLNPGDLAIIAWSGPLRPFHWDPKTRSYETLTCEEKLDFHQVLYEHEVSIRAAANYLKGAGVKFWMTSALMDYKQMELMKDYTRDDYLSWNWIEFDQYNNSLFDICTYSWLSARCQKFPLEQSYQEQSYIVDTYPNLDKKLLADCLHPNQAGHEKIANTLLPYIQN